jgi:DNA-binding protein H-NS
MSIDLSTLSVKELNSLISTAKKQQAKLSKRAPITQVRAKLIKIAVAEGYSIEELFGGAAASTTAAGKRGRKPGPKPGRKLGKVPPKYRNPANPKETWTGRGKQPRWLASLLSKGKKAEEFLIKAIKK